MKIVDSTASQPEATEMVSDGEIITGMDPKLYNAAFEVNIDAFKQVQGIELQLTPNRNMVLHVHFTAQTESVSKQFVEFITSLCPSLVLQAHSKGETPCHIAARYGHFAAEILIEHSRTFSQDLESRIGAEKKLIRAVNHEEDSAMHEAVRYNHIELILIREDHNHLYPAKKGGETPLYIAC